MGYEIHRLLPRHFKVMDLLLLGEKQKDIARQLDLTPQAVCAIVHSPIFQEYLPKRRVEIAEKCHEEGSEDPRNPTMALHKVGMKAAEVQGELLDSEDERVRQRAAISILDRLGIRAGTVQQREMIIRVEL